MSKVRVLYNPDKSVSVICPAPKSKKENETEEEWLERVFTKTTMPMYNKHGVQVNTLFGLPYDDIDSSELPQTKEDSDAWEGEKGLGVVVNQAKAQKNREGRDNEIKIDNYIRQTAIDNLKTAGNLPDDYEL